MGYITLIFVPGRAFRSNRVMEQFTEARSAARRAAIAADIPAAPPPIITTDKELF